MVENEHHHFVGLLQTMRSDLKDNTGESVGVKVASWLARYCAWKWARLSIGDDGLTTSKRQRCKDCTRSFRRMLADQQWNPETQRMFVGVLWSPSGIASVSHGRIRKRDITRVLVKAHEAIQRYAVGKGDAQAHVLKCRKRLEDIFVREKVTGQPRDVLQRAVMGRADEEARPVEQRVIIGEETEMKRMWELAVWEEVSEELANGKSIWNSTWFDSRGPGLVRSRVGENRVGGACNRENVFAGTPPPSAMHLVLYQSTSRGHG